MIATRDVLAAEHIVDTAGLVDILIEGRQRSQRGRKTSRNLYRLFLIGGLLNIIDRGNLVVVSIHRTLTKDLSLDHQERLGVRTRAQHPDGTTTWETLDIEDLYRVTKTLSRDLNYGTGTAPDLDDTERARRHEVIRTFCDSTMDVFDLGCNATTVAMDATGIWAWGKGKRRSTNTDKDPGPTDHNDPDNTDATAEPGEPGDLAA